MNKYGEVKGYVIHKDDNVRPLQQMLFGHDYSWTGGGRALKHFDEHLVVTIMSDGKKYVSIASDYDKTITEYGRTPMTKDKLVKELFDLSIDEDQYTITSDSLLDNTVMSYRNAMYPYITTFELKDYHFKDTSEIIPYFKDEMGFIIK